LGRLVITLALLVLAGCGDDQTGSAPRSATHVRDTQSQVGAWDLAFSSVLHRGRATSLWQRRVPYLPRRYVNVVVRNAATAESGSTLRVYFYFLDESHHEVTLGPGEVANSAAWDTEEPVMRMAAIELAASESRVQWAIR